MKIRPVKRKRIPKYPRNDEINKHPELLKNLPKRWEKNKAVIAALASLSMIGTVGCNQIENSSENSNSSNSVTGIVSPIFYHGKGTGALGCEMVAPPVFLSEAEALAIIKNEAASAGIHLDDTPKSYTVSPKTTMDDKMGMSYTLGESVHAEAFDKEKNVAVSYISMEESEKVYDNMLTSVRSFFPKQHAEQTAESWREAEIPYTMGTFYDPGVNIDAIKVKNEPGSKSFEQAAKTQLEQNLRAQVKDFLEWLKGQGVI